MEIPKLAGEEELDKAEARLFANRHIVTSDDPRHDHVKPDS